MVKRSITLMQSHIYALVQSYIYMIYIIFIIYIIHIIHIIYFSEVVML